MAKWTAKKQKEVNQAVDAQEAIAHARLTGKKPKAFKASVSDRQRDVVNKYKVPTVRLMDDGMFEQFTGVSRDRSDYDLQGKEIQLIIDIHNGKRDIDFNSKHDDVDWDNPDNNEVALPYYQFLASKYKRFCDNLRTLHNYIVGTKLIAMERGIIQSLADEDFAEMKVKDRIDLLKTINMITNTKPTAVTNNTYVINSSEEAAEAKERLKAHILKDPVMMRMLSTKSEVVEGELVEPEDD